MKEVTLIMIAALISFYIVTLITTIVLDGHRYACEKSFMYNKDYIFPARAISCLIARPAGEWMNKEVK